MSTDELTTRVANLERAFQMLTELFRRSDERADTHLEWINALGKAQAENEAKITALIDAQIRTEDELRRLAATQEQLTSTQEQLTATQDRLTITQDRLTITQDRLTAVQVKTDEEMQRLAVAQIKTEEALQRLADDRR